MIGFKTKTKGKRKGPKPYWKKRDMNKWGKSRAGQRWAGFSV